MGILWNHVRNRLKNMKNEHFHNIVRKHKIRLLARYVDDILVIYDSVTSNENDVVNDLNSIPNKIKCTHENEINNIIIYLDLTIIKYLKKKVIVTAIYHKPTSNTTVIHNKSRHTFETKIKYIQ